MTFTLTDSLIEKMQSALENQEQSFLVDAEHNILVEKDGSVEADDTNYYELPEWDSAAGFKLREDFVNDLRIPLVKEELQEVLHSGRGVFRNFRLVLKKYPEIEKRWHIYKNRTMQLFINNWYNDLREIWGLEKLDYLPENDEMLIHDDFSFTEFTADNKQTILQHAGNFFRDDELELPEDYVSAVTEAWKEQFVQTDAENQTGYICCSLSEEFAGCIITSPISEKYEKVMIATSLFVPENFRGLGIGTELISMCLSQLKARGKRWLILPNTIIPEILEPLLFRNGFIKTGTGYAVNLQ